MHPAFHFQPGSAPLLISMPHVGTTIPAEVAAQMLPVAQEKADTDWHLALLYNMAQELGASTLIAEHSRYVIDLNRAPDNANLYPGQDTTGLCPVDTFAKQPCICRIGYRPRLKFSVASNVLATISSAIASRTCPLAASAWQGSVVGCPLHCVSRAAFF